MFLHASEIASWKRISGRTAFAVVLYAVLAGHVCAQSFPSWPDLRLTTCPLISTPKAGYQRTWKLGQTEQNDFEAIPKVQDPKQRAALLLGFAKKYPDSDFRDLALVLAIQIGSSVKDVDVQIEAATVILRSPQGEAASLLVAFTTLDALLAGYVLSSDPEQDRKLKDLEFWTRCGRQTWEALLIQVGGQTKGIEALRKDSVRIFERTSGFVAFQRHDYSLARQKLEKAAELDPQDALTYLFLSSAEFGNGGEDASVGIFYLARAAELAPQVPSLSDLLKQSYTTLHGSEEGLDRLRSIARSSPTVPAGFRISPPKQKAHHAGTAIAAAVIVGLLVYAAAEHPNVTRALGQSMGGGQSNVVSGSSKLMLFGGADHKTYLGCLSCPEYAVDSVSNTIRENGSPYSQTSVWNHFSQFGSVFSSYSVCNPHASDPPVIVDEEGVYYGRLTLNRFHPQIGLGIRLIPWLENVICVN